MDQDDRRWSPERSRRPWKRRRREGRGGWGGGWTKGETKVIPRAETPVPEAEAATEGVASVVTEATVQLVEEGVPKTHL